MSARARGMLLMLLISCVAAAQALASVRASLDSSRVAEGNTVQLTLEHDGRTRGQPDLTPLQRDFDILGTSSSTSVEIVNGSASETVQVVLTLAPKVTGHLTVPPLSWDGEQSRPLPLTVTGPGGAAGAAGAQPAADVFMETSASPEHPYVQAAVHLTVRLFTSEPLYHADLELPENGQVLVKQVGADANSTAERNGRTYQVVTRRYLLFPQHSGKVDLAGPVLDAEVAVSRHSPFGSDPFGGAFFGGPLLARPVRLHGKPIVLTVRPRPGGAIGSYWLPASDVKLSAAWDPAKLAAPAGDPVTLDIELQATGLTAAQLPDIASLLSIPAALKSYPDQPKLTDSTQGGTLTGSRDQTIALLGDSPGHFTIPALTISWWDTRTNQPRTATLPARTLTILPPPGTGPAAATAPPARVTRPGPAPTASPTASPTPGSAAPRGRALPGGSPSSWEWISIGLAVAWLATLGAWLRSRRPRAAARSPRRRQSPPNASRERAAFRAACETNDAHAARAHLLAWASALWGPTVSGVGAIASRVGDPAVAELLRDLDRGCYAGGEWQGAPLAAALTELPAKPAGNRGERDALEPLYR